MTQPGKQEKSEERSSPYSHDAIFKRTFSTPEHALDLMRRQLPAELVRALDPGSLREESGTFIDDALKETRSDVLFSATLGGAPVLVYVLIEHQSTQDPLMPFRLVRYVVRIWEKWLDLARAKAGGATPTTLPPVIPFVLHQGPGEWRVARSLAGVVPLPAALEAVVRPLLPGLEMSLLDLGPEGPEAIRDWQADPVVKLTLALMRAVVDEEVDVAALLTAFGSELREIMARPGGAEVFSVVVRYTVRRRKGLDVAGLAARAAALAGREAGEVVRSTADELIERGVRETLARLIRVRFGSCPSEVMERLADASREELERWTERFVTAARVEDVFDPD